MKFLNKNNDGKKTYSDVVAVDLGHSSTKAVRFKKVKQQLVVSAVGLEEAVGLSGETTGSLALPKRLAARYGAVAVSGKQMLVRLLSIPSNISSSADVATRIREQMHLDTNFRIAQTLARESKGSKDREFIVVACPEEEASRALSLMGSGPTAAMSLEASGLAALKAFTHAKGKEFEEQSVAVLETGAHALLLGVFSRGSLSLLRTFNFGENALIRHVQDRLGVGESEAQAMITGGGFDMTETVQSVMRPFIEQLTLSRDYIERRDGLPVSSLFVSGGMGMSSTLLKVIEESVSMSVQPWNPFENLTLGPDAFPEELEGHEARFAAAVGLGLERFGRIMNLQVNLIKNGEVRNNAAVSPRMISMAGAVGGAVLVALIILKLITGAGSERKRLVNAEAEWKELEPRYEKALAVVSRIQARKGILDQLDRWRDSAIHWAQPMEELQGLVPNPVQLTKLNVQGAHRFIEESTGASPDDVSYRQVRQYKILLSGRVSGERGDQVVLDFVRQLPNGKEMKPLLATAKLQKMQKDPYAQDESPVRLFAIEGQFYEREL